VNNVVTYTGCTWDKSKKKALEITKLEDKGGATKESDELNLPTSLAVARRRANRRGSKTHLEKKAA